MSMGEYYREGQDDLAARAEAEAPDTSEDPKEAGTGPASGVSPEDVYTAVLLIQRNDGVVVPVVDLPNLNKVRTAGPHDIFRMCEDAAAQINGVRIVGEVLRGSHQLLDTKLEGLVRANLAQAMIQRGGSR